MRKNILMLFAGFVAGALSVGTLAVTVLTRQKYNYGKYHGELMTKLAIVERLPTALGDDYRVGDGYRALFEVKDTAVVIVERNGVRTLRVYHGRGSSSPSQMLEPATNRPPSAAASRL